MILVLEFEYFSWIWIKVDDGRDDNDNYNVVNDDVIRTI